MSLPHLADTFCRRSPCRPVRLASSPWRAPASVDSHRSGTMVYEEKNRSGIDTPEVHCRV